MKQRKVRLCRVGSRDCRLAHRAKGKALEGREGQGGMREDLAGLPDGRVEVACEEEVCGHSTFTSLQNNARRATLMPAGEAG